MSDDDLQAVMASGPAPGSNWKHLKTGGTYAVVCVAVRESDLTPCVVYQNAGTGVRWVRPLPEFADGRFVELVGN